MAHDSLQEASRKLPIVSGWAGGDTRAPRMNHSRALLPSASTSRRRPRRRAVSCKLTARRSAP
eukprot:1776788-Pyramimonas_sp.AAC.1